MSVLPFDSPLRVYRFLFPLGAADGRLYSQEDAERLVTAALRRLRADYHLGIGEPAIRAAEEAVHAVRDARDPRTLRAVELPPGLVTMAELLVRALVEVAHDDGQLSPETFAELTRIAEGLA